MLVSLSACRKIPVVEENARRRVRCCGKGAPMLISRKMPEDGCNAVLVLHRHSLVLAHLDSIGAKSVPFNFHGNCIQTKGITTMG